MASGFWLLISYLLGECVEVEGQAAGEGGEGGGRGGGEGVFAAVGEADFEFPGVEHEGGVGEAGVGFAVDGVADYGGADGFEVNADLVGAAGDEGDAQEGGFAAGGQYAAAGFGVFGVGNVHGEFFAVGGVPADRPVNHYKRG